MDRKYPTELQLNRANSSVTEAPFLELTLCISNGWVSTKIYDKRDDFDFDIANFPFLDGVPHMGYTYLNLLDSLELLQILMTSTTVIKPLLPNFLGKAIVILNFVSVFEILSQTQCLVRNKKRQSENTSATRYIGTRILR